MLLLILKNGETIGFTSGNSSDGTYYIDLIKEHFLTLKDDGTQHTMTANEFKSALSVIGRRKSPLFTKSEISVYFREHIKQTRSACRA